MRETYEFTVLKSIRHVGLRHVRFGIEAPEVGHNCRSRDIMLMLNTTETEQQYNGRRPSVLIYGYLIFYQSGWSCRCCRGVDEAFRIYVVYYIH